MIESAPSISDSLEALGLTQKQTETGDSKKELGQADFLTLMTTQLQNQDPMSPMESDQFLGQMAQFSMVSGLEDLQASFNELASSMVSNQALQASQLLGHSVLIPGGVGNLLEEEGLAGSVELPAAIPDLNLNVYDSGGQLVRQLSMAGQGPGMVDFKWDGFDETGQALPPGPYQFSVEGTVNGETQGFETFTLAPVQSVALAPELGELMLDLGELGQIGLDVVRQIR